MPINLFTGASLIRGSPWIVSRMHAKATPLKTASSSSDLSLSTSHVIQDSNDSTELSSMLGHFSTPERCEAKSAVPRANSHEPLRVQPRQLRSCPTRKRSMTVSTARDPGQPDLSAWIRPTTGLLRLAEISEQSSRKRTKLYDRNRFTNGQQSNSSPSFHNSVDVRTSFNIELCTTDIAHGSSTREQSLVLPVRRLTTTSVIERLNRVDRIYDRKRTIKINFDWLPEAARQVTYELVEQRTSIDNRSLETKICLQVLGKLSDGMLLVQALDKQNIIVGLYVTKEDAMLKERAMALLDASFKDMNEGMDSDGLIRIATR